MGPYGVTVSHNRNLIFSVLLSSIVLVALGSPQNASAQSSANVFGPETFARSGAAKDLFSESFSVPDTSVPYSLIVTNGQQDGSQQVRKVWITLNGTQIISPTVFTGSTRQLMVELHPAQQNTLSIKLKGGDSGANVTVSVGPIPSTLLTDPNAAGFDAAEVGLGTPFGVAVDQQNHIAYVADRYWDAVVKFDLTSYSIVQWFKDVDGDTPPGAGGTTGLKYNPAGQQLVAMNEGMTNDQGASVAVITPATASVQVTPVLISGQPIHSDFIAVNSNNNIAAFATLYDGGRTACFMDLGSGSMTTHVQSQDLYSPAVNTVTSQFVFAGINNEGKPDLVVFAASAPFSQIKVISSSAPAGTNFDKIAINPATNMAIAVNQLNASVSLFDLSKGAEVARLPITVGDVTYSGADVAINTAGNFAVVTSTFTNHITVVDLTARLVAGEIVLPQNVRPLGIDIDQASNRAIISENGLGSNDRNGSILVVQLPVLETP
jgi:DNA-binding beta-propeller fold protein YncE